MDGCMDGTASSINQINAIIQLWWCISETHWHLEPEQRQQPQQTVGTVAASARRWRQCAHAKFNYVIVVSACLTASSLLANLPHPRFRSKSMNAKKSPLKKSLQFAIVKKSAINIITASRDQPERIIVDAEHHRLLQEITYTVQMDSNSSHHTGWLLTKCCYDQINMECGISKLLQSQFRSDSLPCAFGMIISVIFRVTANTTTIYKKENYLWNRHSKSMSAYGIHWREYECFIWQTSEEP